MSKAHVKQNMGGAAAAVEAYRNSPTPNVIILEATANKDMLVDQLDELSAILRRRHQGHHSGQGQRHHSLSPVDGARSERISGLAVQRGRLRAGDLASLQGSRRQAGRPRRVGGGREGRRRRLDDRPQSRVATGARTGDGDDRGRSRSRFRHGGARLQSGPSAGRSGSRVRPGTRRLRLSSIACFRNAARISACWPLRRCSTGSTTSARPRSIP